MEDNSADSEVFKKPTFLPVSSANKVPSTENSQNVSEKVELNEKPLPEQEIEPPKKHSVQKAALPIPYTEPSWGGKPDVLYSLEVKFQLY